MNLFIYIWVKVGVYNFLVPVENWPLNGTWVSLLTTYITYLSNFKKEVLGDLKTFVLMTTNLCMNLRYILLHTYLSSHNSPLSITNAFVRAYTIPYLRKLTFCCTTRFFKVVLQYFLWYLTNKRIYMDNAGHCSM